MKMRFVLLALVALLAACGINDRTTGTIELSFGFQRQQSLIGPPISMDVTTYTVAGAGPSSTSFGPLVVTGTTVVGDLLPGLWTLTVVGKNAAGDTLGSGTGVVTVVIGQTASCAITVVETAGAGSYRLNVTWEPDVVLAPVFQSSLKNFAGTEFGQPMTIDPVACTATGLADPLPAGYFSNIVTLWDAPNGIDGTEVLSTGFATIVRVAAGHRTTGNVQLHAVQGFGSIEILIDLDMHNPLILTPNIAWGDVQVYTGETVTFSVTADVAADAVWYLRGQPVGTGLSFDLVANGLMIDEGYRLDCLVFSTDGTRAQSGSWFVARSELSPAMIRIGGSVSTTSFSYGDPCTVTLYQSPDFENAIATIATVNGGPYAFNSLPAAVYAIKARFGESGTDWSWWNAGQLKQIGASPSEVITIPQDGTGVFNFLMLMGG